MPRRSRIHPHDAAASDREIRRIEDAASNATPSDVRWNQGQVRAESCRCATTILTAGLLDVRPRFRMPLRFWDNTASVSAPG
jgi:hypothetical protein